MSVRRVLAVALVVFLANAAVCATPAPDPLAAYADGDYRTAYHGWLALAEEGSSDAAVWLGHLHRLGRGVEEDHRQAYHWYLRAAEAGHPEGAYHVAVMYYHGAGTRRDNEAAAGWLARAADAGHIDAMVMLAIWLEDGVNVEQDLQRAFALYRRAAQAGDADAQYRTGAMLLFGHGIEVSHDEALYWLELAGAKGVPEVAELAGRIHEEGLAGRADLELARDWYRRAALAGHGEAMLRLARLQLEAGDAEERTAAVDWILAAARLDMERAIEVLCMALDGWPEAAGHPGLRAWLDEDPARCP